MHTTMRSLSFVDHLLFKDVYTSSSRNMCLFDVDKDGDNELILGFWDSGPLLENGEANVENNFGSLYVIKHRQIWKVYRELGMVLCITAGCVASSEQPWILALCADSNCYAFSAINTWDGDHCIPFCSSSETKSKGKEALILNVVHQQQLAYNARDICIIHSDNGCDIAVAYSDRIVRLYAWCSSGRRSTTDGRDSQSYGKFIILIKWELAGQVNRIDAHITTNGETMLIASQPGGGFAVLQRNFVKHNNKIIPTLLYYPPHTDSACNPDARTWIVGNVRSNLVTATKHPSTTQEIECSSCLDIGLSPTGFVKPIMAVGMADGTVIFIDPAATKETEQVLWSAQLHLRGELFGLSRLDLTKSGTDEVCACAWDGTTYVFNDRKEILRFPMGRSCQAFTAGWFAVEPGRNEPVFVYSTCENSLLIYHKLHIDRLAEPDLLLAIKSNEGIISMLRSLNIDSDNRAQLREVVHKTLYQYSGLDELTLTKLATDTSLPQEPLWVPGCGLGSTLLEFMRYVERAHQLQFSGDYHKLYAWSIQCFDQFWSDFFAFAKIKYSTPPTHAIEKAARITMIPRWFPGCRLNYAENLLRGGSPDDIAIYSLCDGRSQVVRLTYGHLNKLVQVCARSLLSMGVKTGDRVAGILPNCIEAVLCYLATSYIGAIWSSASPEFGEQGLIQRFSLVQPSVLFAVTHTVYRGKTFDQAEKLTGLINALEPSLRHVVLLPFIEVFDERIGLSEELDREDTFKMIDDPEVLWTKYNTNKRFGCILEKVSKGLSWTEFLAASTSDSPCIAPVQLYFSDPLVIMFSSGTTGPPKCIVHSVGGTLLKHVCEQSLQCDFRPGDRVLFLTTVGWMMWNWLVSALSLGASIVLHEGCPFNSKLWDYIDFLGITAFGTSSKWLAVSEDRGHTPGLHFKLDRLRTILSTGSPLAPRSYDFVYRSIKSDVMLGSISGGTDILGCCVGCCPLLPVYRGQIQCRFLGMAVESWNDQSQPCWDQKGELVITLPFPSMPIEFWGDNDGTMYRKAYFSKFPGVWSHGDYIELHSSTQGATITGRSDATLNPNGVRFGSAEIYNVVECLDGVEDSLCVAQPNRDRTNERVILLIKLTDASHGGSDPLPTSLVETIREAIRSMLSPRMVPDFIRAVSAIPYTVNGKKIELAVRRLLEGHSAEEAFAKESLADPTIIDTYVALAREIGMYD